MWRQLSVGHDRVTGWTAYIEVQVAAADGDEADLLTDWPRCPVDRLGRVVEAIREPLGVPEHRDVQEITARLDKPTRERLDEAYAPMGPPRDHDELTDWYIEALRVAAVRGHHLYDWPASAGHSWYARLVTPTVRCPSPERYWRAVWPLPLLAVDQDDAALRASELAGTVFDWFGRPMGKLTEVRHGIDPDLEVIQTIHLWDTYILGSTDRGNLLRSYGGLVHYAEMQQVTQDNHRAALLRLDAMRARVRNDVADMTAHEIIATSRHLRDLAAHLSATGRGAHVRRMAELGIEAREYLKAGGLLSEEDHQEPN